MLWSKFIHNDEFKYCAPVTCFTLDNIHKLTKLANVNLVGTYLKSFLDQKCFQEKVHFSIEYFQFKANTNSR